MQQTPWPLPSASRHLLNRDKSFFRSQPIKEISAWLRRVQYRIQEIETTEARGAIDIRTWISVPNVASTTESTSRHKKSTPQSAKSVTSW